MFFRGPDGFDAWKKSSIHEEEKNLQILWYCPFNAVNRRPRPATPKACRNSQKYIASTHPTVEVPDSFQLQYVIFWNIVLNDLRKKIRESSYFLTEYICFWIKIFWLPPYHK